MLVAYVLSYDHDRKIGKHSSLMNSKLRSDKVLSRHVSPDRQCSCAIMGCEAKHTGLHYRMLSSYDTTRQL